MGNFSVDYIPEEGFIRVQIQGEFDAQLLSESTSKLVEEITLSKCNRVLMDHRTATPKLSVVELYRRPEVAAKLGVPRMSKIAIVYSEPDEVYNFIETVGVNQGFTVQVFQDIDKGIQWLRGE